MSEKTTDEHKKRGTSLQTHIPIIPDSIVSHISSSVGFGTDDVRIIRVLALAAQKYMASVTNDAMVHCKDRLKNNSTKPDNSEKHLNDPKLALTMEDLVPALEDNGIICKKPPYFV